MHRSTVPVSAVLFLYLGIPSNFEYLAATRIGIRVTNESDPGKTVTFISITPLFVFLLFSNLAQIFDVDKCIPKIPKSETGHLYEIETNGNCVNIYSQENCDGHFVRLQTGFFFTNVRKMTAHRWDNDILVENENITVVSIGPCFDQCDPRNWAGIKRNIPVNVTLFDNVVHSGSPTSSCVELHDDSSCTGNSVQLRPGYPNLHNLWSWGFSDREDYAIRAKSVSFCGHACPPTSPRNLVSPSTMTTSRTRFEAEITNPCHPQIDDGEIRLNEEEQSPAKIRIFLILAILLIAGFTGWGGAHVFKQYRNSYFRYSEERMVVYSAKAEIV
ncbi:hypothetical protein Fcan01_16690 [Folsomia candida]|uniref:Uncharacterized protein n=1 Tax=Folsomia candida TaxID=158441 RepID=A0A226DW68_FOLCA|nr:hypothetical protein Fcan01_16690 [Folsomia candida]